MRILFAWEFGHNFGHIFRQVQIARTLRVRGHILSFAVSDPALANKFLSSEGFAFVQAPKTGVTLTNAHRPICSFADILASHGLVIPACVDAVVTAWQRLFFQARPDVVVLDHAPMALFAARLSGLRTVAIGTGFELPPSVTPFPDFRPWEHVGEASHLETEEAILAGLNAVSVKGIATQFDTLASALGADASLLLTFEELDHYPGRLQANYSGPLYSLDIGQSSRWLPGSGKKILVYLRASDELPPLLTALKALGASVICVVIGIAPALREQYHCDHFQIHTVPLRLEFLLPEADLVIAHNGHGLLSACVKFGIPVLAVPTQLEQMLTSDRVVDAGMGLRLGLNELAVKAAGAIDLLLGDHRYRASATELAEKYRDLDIAKVLSTVVQRIEL